MHAHPDPAHTASTTFHPAYVGLATVPKGQLSLMLRCVAVGKTSLMSALAGKASYGTVTGSVTINGKPDKLLRYKRVMGFVPQVSPAVHFKLTKLLAH